MKIVNLLEPEAGIEPATYALRVRCSTTEPLGRDSSRYRLVYGQKRAMSVLQASKSMTWPHESSYNTVPPTGLPSGRND